MFYPRSKYERPRCDSCGCETKVHGHVCENCFNKWMKEMMAILPKEDATLSQQRKTVA